MQRSISWTCKFDPQFLPSSRIVQLRDNTLTLHSSYPSSPNFGKHWTQEQVHEMFAPSEKSVQAVRDWLVASGIEDDAIVNSEDKGWLAFDIPARQAEDLFQTVYHEHVHSTSGQLRVGCDE